jgi:hypothetical protein
MNEIVHILDYSETSEKQVRLFNLIKKIKKSYQVAVSSHFPLPDWIIKECDFYFYDKKNLLIFDDDIKNNKFFISGSFYIEYIPYKSISAHIIAITRLFLLGNSSLKVLGYDIVHQLEYDCDLINFDEFSHNSILCKEYPLVAYVETIHENTINNPLWYHGVYQTINLNHFNYEDLSYDEEKMKQILIESFLERKEFFQEKLWKKLFYNNKKVYLKELDKIKKSINYNLSSTGDSLWKPDNSFSVFFYQGEIYLFVDNTKQDNRLDLKIIFDDIIIKNFQVYPFNWFIINTNQRPEKNIVVIVGDKITKSFDITIEKDLKLLNSTFLKFNN